MVQQKSVESSVHRSANKRIDTVKTASLEHTASTLKKIKVELLWAYDAETHCLEKDIIHGCVPCSRGRGRPGRRWGDDISDWTGLRINDAARPAEDRDRERSVIRAANPSTYIRCVRIKSGSQNKLLGILLLLTSKKTNKEKG